MLRVARFSLDHPAKGRGPLEPKGSPVAGRLAVLPGCEVRAAEDFRVLVTDPAGQKGAEIGFAFPLAPKGAKWTPRS